MLIGTDRFGMTKSKGNALNSLRASMASELGMN
jgi:hypothetical protein